MALFSSENVCHMTVTNALFQERDMPYDLDTEKNLTLVL